MAKRVLTLQEAKDLYQFRYTMEHVPKWASTPFHPEGELKYYAPQYADDEEWYRNTVFPGEGHVNFNSKHCYSSNESWPLGEMLDEPYQKRM